MRTTDHGQKCNIYTYYWTKHTTKTTGIPEILSRVNGHKVVLFLFSHLASWWFFGFYCLSKVMLNVIHINQTNILASSCIGRKRHVGLVHHYISYHVHQNFAGISVKIISMHCLFSSHYSQTPRNVQNSLEILVLLFHFIYSFYYLLEFL